MKKLLILAATVAGLSLLGATPAAFAEETPTAPTEEIVELPEAPETVAPDVPAEEPVDAPDLEPEVEDPTVQAPAIQAPVAAAPVVKEPAAPIVVDRAPQAPIIIDECQTRNDGWEAPAPRDVADVWVYERFGGTTGDAGFVQAYLPEGFQIGTTGNRFWYPVWELNALWTDAPCVIDAQPAAPTFVDECGVDNDDVIVPADADSYGYEYVEIAAGTHLLNDATVWAVPSAGFVFADGLTTLWDHEFSSDACPVAPVVPDPVTPAVVPVLDEVPESPAPVASSLSLAETGAEVSVGWVALILVFGGAVLLAVRRISKV